MVPVSARPCAGRDAILGERAGAVRIGVSAPPERGKANEAIAEILARSLEIPARQVTILGGGTSRSKRYLIEGMTPQEVREKLAPLLAEKTS